ncbi:MAG: carbohydrate porin [Polyangiaceae bacterium]
MKLRFSSILSSLFVLTPAAVAWGQAAPSKAEAPKADAPKVEGQPAAPSAPPPKPENPPPPPADGSLVAPISGPPTFRQEGKAPEAPHTVDGANETYPAGKFEFGSYGRVRIASDLRGGTGRVTNVAAFGPRTDEESYSEFELRREDKWKPNLSTRIVTTLALFPPFFHFTGKAMQNIALRNLYAQASYGDYTFWVGSRMYRGDDIYLLNWWPLDNQNTVGGGISVKLPKDTVAAFHVGMQRLDVPQQTQVVQDVAPFGFGATDVLRLDRPRMVETLKLTHYLRNSKGRTLFPGNDKTGFKVILYGEAHQIAAGVQRDTVTNKDKSLPDDYGFVVGGQLGYWTGVRDGFIHLFARHARGIAAYDPLASPTTFANDMTTAGASDTLLATGGNLESEWVGVQWGAYMRMFRDASEGSTSRERYDEGSVVVRPNFFFHDHFGLSLEGSYQRRRYALADPEAIAGGGGALTAGVTKFGVIPFFSPAGRGSFRRPQFRLFYLLSLRDSGARQLYAKEDVFSQREVEHFLGLGVEWWFNTTSYP